MWDKCGMARNEAGLKEALERIPLLRQEFWEDVNVLGDGNELNQSLEYAGRVADFMEFAELLVLDALTRDESCGGTFPRRASDAGRRSQARRRELLIRRGVGISGPEHTPGDAQRTAGVRRSPSGAKEL